MVLILPALNQDVSFGKGDFVLSEVLVGLIELFLGADNIITYFTGFVSSSAFVELVVVVISLLLLLAGEEGITYGEDFFDDVPGKGLVEDVPSSNSWVLLHQPLFQLKLVGVSDGILNVELLENCHSVIVSDPHVLQFPVESVK